MGVPFKALEKSDFHMITMQMKRMEEELALVGGCATSHTCQSIGITCRLLCSQGRVNLAQSPHDKCSPEIAVREHYDIQLYVGKYWLVVEGLVITRMESNNFYNELIYGCLYQVGNVGFNRGVAPHTCLCFNFAYREMGLLKSAIQWSFSY